MERKNNFVAPLPKRREMPDLPTSAEVVHTIDVQPIATQHVEVRTSAVDSAWGFLIRSVPLYAMISTATVAVCVMGFGLPWLAMPTLTIFVIVFAASWLVSVLHHQKISPDGVAYMEADRRMSIIEKEHDRRWKYWLRQMGVEHDDE